MPPPPPPLALAPWPNEQQNFFSEKKMCSTSCTSAFSQYTVLVSFSRPITPSCTIMLQDRWVTFPPFARRCCPRGSLLLWQLFVTLTCSYLQTWSFFGFMKKILSSKYFLFSFDPAFKTSFFISSDPKCFLIFFIAKKKKECVQLSWGKKLKWFFRFFYFILIFRSCLRELPVLALQAT